MTRLLPVLARLLRRRRPSFADVLRQALGSGDRVTLSAAALERALAEPNPSTLPHHEE